jgi:hypothetical protein
VRGFSLHRIFAPNFNHRSRIVPRRAPGRVDVDKPLVPMTWARRLKRVFQIDIETCPERRLRRHDGLRACAEDPPLIRNILGHIRRREALTRRLPLAPPDSHLVLNLT